MHIWTPPATPSARARSGANGQRARLGRGPIGTGLRCLMAAACLSPAVAAQDVPGAVVQGRVSGASGVALASVRIVRGGLRPDTIYTDDAGRYRLASLGAGMHLVSFQHIGYLPVEMIVQVTTDTTLAVDVQMERRTVVLDTMSVRAEGSESL